MNIWQLFLRLPWNLVGIFMVPRGWTLTLVTPDLPLAPLSIQNFTLLHNKVCWKLPATFPWFFSGDIHGPQKTNANTFGDSQTVPCVYLVTEGQSTSFSYSWNHTVNPHALFGSISIYYISPLNYSFFLLFCHPSVCFPKDTHFLLRTLRELSSSTTFKSYINFAMDCHVTISWIF